VFHALSLDLLIFERHHAVLSVDMKAREDLGKAYASLHNLVADVASCYSGRMKGLSSSYTQWLGLICLYSIGNESHRSRLQRSVRQCRQWFSRI